jgi:hypothetical protein
MDSTVIVACVAAIPATLAALGAWRNAKQAVHQTNGMLHEPLGRMEENLTTISKLLVSHITDGERHAAAARAAVNIDRADAAFDRSDQIATLGEFAHDRLARTPETPQP